MPRLSVIMPAYNSEETIEAAIRSTLRSMPRDSEILVVDDASDDETFAAIQAIEDPRIRTIRNSSNLGVAATLNLLLEAVDSDYVARMDSDDLCLPWRFSLQLRQLDRHNDADILFGGAIRFGFGKSPRPTLPISYGPMLSAAMLPVRNPYIHPTMLANTAALRRVGGYRIGAAEDYDLWARAASSGVTMRRLARPVICYRQHINQITNQQSYAEHTLADQGLKDSLSTLAAQVYPGVDDDLMWRLLERRLRGGIPLEGVTVDAIRAGLSADIRLSAWESAYLNRWLRKSVGEV